MEPPISARSAGMRWRWCSRTRQAVTAGDQDVPDAAVRQLRPDRAPEPGALPGRRRVHDVHPGTVTRDHARTLGRLAVSAELRQRGVQLAAGADAELGEYLAQMPFDRARGQEQPGADLRISAAVAGQPGNQLLLRSELAPRLDAALAHPLACGDQLAAGTFGERLHTNRHEHVVRPAQLLARVDAPALAA